MLTILRPLLNSKTATVNFTINKLENGEFHLVVNPVCSIDDHEDSELQALKAALSLPILVTGKMDDLEPKLAEYVKQQLPHRCSWEEQIKDVQAALQAAKASKTNKTSDAKATKGNQASINKPKIQEQSPDDDAHAPTETLNDAFEL